ncbi:uncharacterized protein JCM6883_004921 [Sporobolomyces salmoneus]|uniref:uncharacterized protein n=1 Tax=Sporobolomyces salmoneus TaxID=183962 RepID=UPI00317F960A
MSSFSNGDGYQSKGVGGGALGFRTTESTRGQSIPTAVNVLDLGVRPLFTRFLRLSAQSSKNVIKKWRKKGEKCMEKDVEVVEGGTSKKRGQDKRESVLDSSVASPTKKVFAEGTDNSDREVAISLLNAAVLEGDDDEGRAAAEAEGVESDASEAASFGTPSLCRSRSSSSTISSAGPKTPATTRIPQRQLWSKEDVTQSILLATSPSSVNRQATPIEKEVSNDGGWEEVLVEAEENDEVFAKPKRLSRSKYRAGKVGKPQRSEEEEDAGSVKAPATAGWQFFQAKRALAAREAKERWEAKKEAERQRVALEEERNRKVAASLFNFKEQTPNRGAGFKLPDFKKLTSGYGGVMRSSSRSSRRHAYDDDDEDDVEYSDEEEEFDRPPPRRRNSSRRGSISRGMNEMSLARSSSRASRRAGSRRGSVY